MNIKQQEKDEVLSSWKDYDKFVGSDRKERKDLAVEIMMISLREICALSTIIHITHPVPLVTLTKDLLKTVETF